MSEPDSRKVEIKNDIPTGRHLSPPELPPLPKDLNLNDYRQDAPQDDAEMPPLPGDLKEESPERKRESQENLMSIRSKMSQSSGGSKKIIHIKGPVFISLERYREVKGLLNSLKASSQALREMVDDLKENKSEGSNLLSKSVYQLESIEEGIENINSTLRA